MGPTDDGDLSGFYSAGKARYCTEVSNETASLELCSCKVFDYVLVSFFLATKLAGTVHKYRINIKQ